MISRSLSRSRSLLVNLLSTWPDRGCAAEVLMPAEAMRRLQAQGIMDRFMAVTVTVPVTVTKLFVPPKRRKLAEPYYGCPESVTVTV